eukprot:CAMPEP_0206504904 /NCGR_PEP_ID=MMETSP0324_2-20121206/55790_1 /ASSEMBLY_ACC=CAM_ASM_000836 /TAXON_ID=2866 /ORGANISM="Crypthecodinium cohnii, Strain Seligo" /LENGTH=87 /DNA_ID=CAMNT_0053994217 /DNA_START=186 /DNA_END=446 /DNA_ORIENTATION=+
MNILPGEQLDNSLHRKLEHALATTSAEGRLEMGHNEAPWFDYIPEGQVMARSLLLQISPTNSRQPLRAGVAPRCQLAQRADRGASKN